jgi:hypothetical protein
VIVTATSSVVSIEVSRALDPSPADVIAAFEPAHDAQQTFDAELRQLYLARGGLQSVLYSHVMAERGTADAAYGHEEWPRAEADYTRLTSEISNSCHGAHPTMGPIPGVCAIAPRPVAGAYAETTGGIAHTWSDYTHASGLEGPLLQAGETVLIACKVQGYRVADGNPWWYKIASAPWSSAYYVSADAFYNNGKTAGTLLSTPFVDPLVPDCPAS